MWTNRVTVSRIEKGQIIFLLQVIKLAYHGPIHAGRRCKTPQLQTKDLLMAQQAA